MLVPAFQRTAQSIMAWRGVGDVVAGLGRGSVAAIRTLIDMQATSESSPRPRRQGGGLVDKLGPSVRSR